MDRADDEERPGRGSRVQLRDTLEMRLHLQLRETGADAELRMARVLRDRAEELVDVAHADATQHRRAVSFGVRRVGVVPHPSPAQSPGFAGETRSRLAVFARRGTLASLADRGPFPRPR